MAGLTFIGKGDYAFTHRITKVHSKACRGGVAPGTEGGEIVLTGSRDTCSSLPGLDARIDGQKRLWEMPKPGNLRARVRRH